ncbi:MAG: J domain-containing protein [Candidatus Marithrix sp.]
MITPFDILEVTENTTDEKVKKAYLQKICQYPPEHNPEQFQIIRTAFETIKTQSQRVKYQLFHSEIPNIDTLIERILQTNNSRIPTKKVFTKALLESFQKN